MRGTRVSQSICGDRSVIFKQPKANVQYLDHENMKNYKKDDKQRDSTFNQDTFMKIFYEITQPHNGSADSLDHYSEQYNLFIECYGLFCLNFVTIAIDEQFKNLGLLCKNFWTKVTTEYQECLSLEETKCIIASADEYVFFVIFCLPPLILLFRFCLKIFWVNFLVRHLTKKL